MTKRREPYAKLFASWHSHPRTGSLSLAAGGLEARMLSWSVCHGTNGRVPRSSLGSVTGGAPRRDVDRALAELVSTGVVIDDGDTLVVRDFLDANISKERDDERRANQVERQDRSRGLPLSRVTGGQAPYSVTRDKTVCHTPSLDHDHDHDHLQEIVDLDLVAPGDSAAPRGPDPVRFEVAKARLIRGYVDRYKAATGDAWMSWAANDREIRRVAAFCALGEGEPSVRADAVLDGAFADTWMADHRWPWAKLAKDPAAFGPKPTPPQPSPESEADALARRKTEIATKNARIYGAKAAT
jgi:hypothetical protein